MSQASLNVHNWCGVSQLFCLLQYIQDIRNAGVVTEACNNVEIQIFSAPELHTRNESKFIMIQDT